MKASHKYVNKLVDLRNKITYWPWRLRDVVNDITQDSEPRGSLLSKEGEEVGEEVEEEVFMLMYEVLKEK